MGRGRLLTPNLPHTGRDRLFGPNRALFPVHFPRTTKGQKLMKLLYDTSDLDTNPELFPFIKDRTLPTAQTPEVLELPNVVKDAQNLIFHVYYRRSTSTTLSRTEFYEDSENTSCFCWTPQTTSGGWYFLTAKNFGDEWYPIAWGRNLTISRTYLGSEVLMYNRTLNQIAYRWVDLDTEGYPLTGVLSSRLPDRFVYAAVLTPLIIYGA